MMFRVHQKLPGCGSRRSSVGSGGFSLLELLVVVSMIVILMALLVGALPKAVSNTGRQGAVDVTMTLLEQARVAALESGADVYVIFWRRTFPERDAILVARKRTEFDPPSTSGSTYVFLTKWEQLPRGTIFRSLTKTITPKAGVTPPDYQTLPFWGSGRNTPDRLSYVQFNPTGGIDFPKVDLNLYVSEGVRDSGGSEAAISADHKEGAVGGVDRIELFRFTGRARLDVSLVRS